MKQEIIYGLIAAISWSLYVIILKIVLREISIRTVLPLLGLGVFVSALISSILFRSVDFGTTNWKFILLSFLSGVLWFLGILSVNYGLKKGLNLSIMAPIYNINTLLVVLLSIFILKESVDPLRVIIAAILVTIATILLA